jgi:Ca2+-dependent lipid-binding protein
MKDPLTRYFKYTFWGKTQEMVTIWLFLIGFLCYLFGRLGASFLLVFFMLMAAYVILKQTSLKERRERVQRKLHDENLWENRKFLQHLLTEIPVWIQSTEWEQGRFLQIAMEQGWPALRMLTDQMLRTYVNPILDWVKPSFLKTIEFGDINFGSRYPQIEGIKNAGEPNQEQMILDIKLAIQPANIDLHIQPMSGMGLKAGLRDLTIKGTFRLVFAPLIGDSPFIGGIRLGFAERPAINFKIKAPGMGFKVIPGLECFLENLVESLIVDYFCWPYDYFVPLIDIEKPSDDADDPKGMLQVIPLQARELQNTRKVKISKPDPLCEISIHGKKKRTKVAKHTMSPVWRESAMEFILNDMKNSILDITVFDKNKTGVKKMGYARINLGDIKWNLDEDTLPVTKWLKLLGTKSGEVKLQLLWKPYQKQTKKKVQTRESDARDLPKIDKQAFSPRSIEYISGLLIIEIQCAQNLIAKDKRTRSSDPYVKIYLNRAKSSDNRNNVMKTTIKKRTLEPTWNEEFRIKVDDSLNDVVNIEVFDWNKLSKHDELGNVIITIQDIVENNGSVDDWYDLGEGKGKIKIKARYMSH